MKDLLPISWKILGSTNVTKHIILPWDTVKYKHWLQAKMNLGLNKASLTFTLLSASLSTLVLFSATEVRTYSKYPPIAPCQHADLRDGSTDSRKTEPWSNSDWPLAGPLLTHESSVVCRERWLASPSSCAPSYLLMGRGQSLSSKGMGTEKIFQATTNRGFLHQKKKKKKIEILLLLTQRSFQWAF